MRWILIGLGAVALIAIGLAITLTLPPSGSEVPALTADDLEPELPKPEPEPEPELIYNPLTGLPVPEEISARVIQVSIDNSPDARPHSGVSKADIIYEMPAEGNIPRIEAIFYSQVPEKIGPVRSARPYFVDEARGWGALFVHCGWSPSAKRYLESGVVDYMNELSNGEAYFWRASDRYAPHNLYTNGENIYQYLNDKGLATTQETSFLPFRTDGAKLKMGAAADYVEFSFSSSNANYRYDAASGLYARYSGDEPYIDKETGEQLMVANIIMQRVRSGFEDSYGRLVIDMCEGGEAYLFTSGRVVPGTWSRADLDTGTEFVDQNGNAFSLTPGQTWIEVCDGNVDFSYKDSRAIEAVQ